MQWIYKYCFMYYYFKINIILFVCFFLIMNQDCDVGVNFLVVMLYFELIDILIFICVVFVVNFDKLC